MGMSDETLASIIRVMTAQREERAVANPANANAPMIYTVRLGAGSPMSLICLSEPLVLSVIHDERQLTHPSCDQ